MDIIFEIIIIIAIALAVLALILKILSKFPIVNYIVLFGVALAMLIMGFVCATEDNANEFNGLLATVEGTLFFAYMIFGYADIALDRSEYYETTATYNDWTDTVHVETRLASSSNFWGCVGISALTGYGVTFFLHAILNSQAGSGAIGIIGIIASVWSAIRIISFFRGYISAKRRRKDYY